MYTQLTIIFITLGVFAVLHVITFCMVMKNRGTGTKNVQRPIKSEKTERTPRNNNQSDAEMFRRANVPDSDVQVIVCRKCLCKYDSRYNVCPRCGTLR